jgi:predicted transcriptional regulator
MLTKAQSIDTVKTLSEIDKLIVIDKIERGLKDVKEGKVYTTEQVRAKLAKWLK